MAENKKCWACKRILVGESKIGLCPDCVNKYGTRVAAVVAGAGVGLRLVTKNSGKIIRVVSKVIKH